MDGRSHLARRRSPSGAPDRPAEAVAGASYTAGIELLVVCTGNINRSPMGEVLLAARLAERGATAVVASAGTRATLGPASPEVVELMAGRGLDLAGHVSRQLTPELVAPADLVVGMAREHVREAALLSPDALGRTFTMKELVRRGAEHGPRHVDEPLADWLARLAADRDHRELLGMSDVDDVADPIGQRLPAYRRAAEEIDELAAGIARLVAPVPGAAP